MWTPFDSLTSHGWWRLGIRCFKLARSTTALCVTVLLVSWLSVDAREPLKKEDLWSLKPVVRPEIPEGVTTSKNPIDAFIAKSQRAKGVSPLCAADKLAWLRRVSLDLTGLPPTLEEQAEFAEDRSTNAIDKVVDRLLASEQHGVRYGRHWLDVLRYTDVDENMPASEGIYLWRDWVIGAINQDLPYDEFVRAQILGNRAAQRRIISPAGHLTPVGPRPEDLFAQGFLARGAADGGDSGQQLAFSAVETISTAFMGMTVGCAKCHDHFFDPIKQSDFYSMKALFDPLVLHRVELATPQQVFAYGRAVQEHETRLWAVVNEMRKFIEPYHTRLYEERLRSFPEQVQSAVRKPEKERTVEEQKIADDYYPILRIDPSKIKAVMPADQIKRYDEYLKQINAMKAPEPLPAFWAVAEDAKRADEQHYILNTGDPARPKKDRPVQPGYPFAEHVDFRHGRREAFVDWLTDASNPLFARVAVNRIWQWHFGTGLHANPSDFGALGGQPTHPELLDWLASEFVEHHYSMKWLDRLIVTSETYQRSSKGERDVVAANTHADPQNETLWRFPLRRLEAEPVRDSILFAAGKLDLTVGGKSFDGEKTDSATCRRAAYMSRGYRSNADAMPGFLQTFDAEDGRAVCPRRNQTVTAPQALFLMNHDLLEDASVRLGERLKKDSFGDVNTAVTLGYRITLGHPPSNEARAQSLDYLHGDTQRLKGFAWLLFNLDEFLYVP